MAPTAIKEEARVVAPESIDAAVEAAPILSPPDVGLPYGPSTAEEVVKEAEGILDKYTREKRILAAYDNALAIIASNPLPTYYTGSPEVIARINSQAKAIFKSGKMEFGPRGVDFPYKIPQKPEDIYTGHIFGRNISGMEFGPFGVDYPGKIPRKPQDRFK